MKNKFKQVLVVAVAAVLMSAMAIALSVAAGAAILKSDHYGYERGPYQDWGYVKDIALLNYDPDFYETALNPGTAVSNAWAELRNMLQSAAGNDHAANEYSDDGTDLNDGAGGNYIYLGWTTTKNADMAVRGMRLWAGDDPNEAAPTHIVEDGIDWYLVNSGAHEWVPRINNKDEECEENGGIDLNDGAGGYFIYLYITKDPAYGPPLTYITVDHEIIDTDGAETTMRFKTDLIPYNVAYSANAGTDGSNVYIVGHTDVIPLNLPTLYAVIERAETVHPNKNGFFSNPNVDDWTYLGNRISDARYIAQVHDDGDVIQINGAGEIDARIDMVNEAITRFDGKVMFDAATNGGSISAGGDHEFCTMDAELNVTVDLTAHTAEKAGYDFLGWSTDKDAMTGVKDTMTIPAGTRLYAIFRKVVQATFKYYNSSNTIVSTEVNGTLYNNDTEATYLILPMSFIPNKTPTVDGKEYSFLGWQPDINALPPKYDAQATSLKGEENETFYGVYSTASEYSSVAITFDTKGGSALEPLNGKAYLSASGRSARNIAVLTEEPTNPCAEFLGWSRFDKAQTVEYTTGAAVSFSNSMTFYAVWRYTHAETGLCPTCGGLMVNENNFPDAYFRDWMMSANFPSGNDGFLDAEELAAVTQISLADSDFASISDLTGIEYFANLQELAIHETKVTALDVSQNKQLKKLNITKSPVAALDLSQNPALDYLYCIATELRTLDVSNTPVTILDIYKNKLETIKLDGCTSLQRLYCQENQLTSLDIGDCTALTNLRCDTNRISELNFENNTALTQLRLSANPLTSMDVTMLGELVHLEITRTSVSSLDVSGNPKLDLLVVTGCENLLSLDVSGNPVLRHIEIMDTKISTLDLTGKSHMEYIYASNSPLTALDTSDCTELLQLSAYGTQITSLDLTASTKLTHLYMSNSSLAELKLPQSSTLSVIDIDGTQITSLDLNMEANPVLYASDLRKEVDLHSAASVDMSAFGDPDRMEITSGGTPDASGFLTLANGAAEVVYVYDTGKAGKSITVTLFDPTLYATAFENVSISLGEDIAVKYYTVRSNFTSPEMRFTLNGYTETVAGTLEGDQFVFVFEGVAPQWMGDTVVAELMIGGEVKEIKEYSVLEYLTALKGKTATELMISEAKHSAMLTLINDLLVYGGAAQKYTDHKTDAPVSAGVTGTEFVDIASTDTVVDNGENVRFTGATVVYNSVNAMKFRFTATDTAGVVLKVKVNGGAETELTYESEAGGSYTVTTDAVKAACFDDVYTVTAYDANGAKLSSLTYSVKSYVYAKQGGSGNIAELAKATYNYGLAAKAYRSAQ